MGYVGSYIQNELERAGEKPSEEQRKSEAARKRVLEKYLGVDEAQQNFADPAAFFS